MSVFTGSAVAIVTPFQQDGTVHYDMFEKLIEFQLKNHSDGIVVCGTTGEASTLTDEEQIKTIQFAVDVVAKRVPVIAGTGSNDTAHGVHLSKMAEKTGVNALLSVTPYYNKTTQKGLIQHYSQIASSVSIPIILYNIAGRTGLNITPTTMYELSKIPNIVGVKEASGNITQVAEIAQLCGSDFELYAGNDDQVVPTLSLGGVGVISAAANVVPQQMHDIVEKFLSGDTKGSLSTQLALMPLIQALFIEVNPIPVKEGLRLMGFDVGGYRMPLVPMEPANHAILKAEMEKFGLIG